MKYLLIIPLLLVLLGVGSAQDESPRWNFGIEAGFNTARLTKGGSLFKKSGTVSVSGNRLGYHGMLLANYRLDNQGQFSTGLGLTRLQHQTSRERDGLKLRYTLEEYTQYDVVRQDMLLLTLPVSVRYFAISREREGANEINPFLELGFRLQIPLVNDSYYEREVDTRGRISGPPPRGGFGEGDLAVQFPGLFVKAGVLFGGNVTLSYGWEFLRSKGANDNEIKYITKIQVFSLGYFLGS